MKSFKYSLTNRQIGIIFGIGLLVVVLVLVAVNIFKHQSSPRQVVDIAPTTVEILPNGWQKIDFDSKNVLYKAEKQNNQAYKPTLILTSSSIQIKNSSDYVASLVRGARSTLPSLRYATDTDASKNDVYSRIFKGYYYNSGHKINLYQQLFIKSNQVFTLTLSYLDGGVETSEADSLISKVISTQLPKELDY